MGEGELLVELQTIVPPPAKRIPESVDWADFERGNGFSAPISYREFIDTYGCGKLVTSTDDMWIYHPAPPGQTFVESSQWERDLVRESYVEHPWMPQGPVYPEAGGMLTWGCMWEGEPLGWVTDGDPDEWPIVFGFDEDVVFPYSFLEFVVRWLRGDLVHPLADFAAEAQKRDGHVVFQSGSPVPLD